MSLTSSTLYLLLPDLQFVKEVIKKNAKFLYCQKVSEFEVCPHCASKSFITYDRENKRCTYP